MASRTGAKPPAGKTDETKKPTTTSSRLSTSARAPTTPTSGRVSAMASRTSGTTSVKPATRPTTSTVRKTTTKADDENKRPSTTTATSRTPRVAETSDKTRRTTLGTSSASVTPKRPSTLSSRTSTSSPTIARRPASSASRPGSSGSAKRPASPASKSSGTVSGARPLSREIIPEEAAMASGDVDDDLTSPTESIAQRLSTGLQAKFRSSDSQFVFADDVSRGFVSTARHARTNSDTASRPSTAPHVKVAKANVEGLHPDRIQDLFRERKVLEIMATRIDDLHAENEQLKEQNRQLEAAAKANSGEHTTNGSADNNETLEALRNTHATEIESLHSSHAEEISSLRSELDTQRKQSSNLTGVEAKIQAVEQALQETRAKASQNEQDLQQRLDQKESEREKLVQNIEDLQAKLGDREQQRGPVEEDAKNEIAALRLELEQEKQRNLDAAEEVHRERQKSVADFEKTLAEMREKNDTKVQELNLALTSAKETNGKLQEYTDESDAPYEEDDEDEDEDDEDDRHQDSMDESAIIILALRDEINKFKTGHTATLEQQKQLIKEKENMVNELRAELEALQNTRGEERDTGTQSHATLQSTIDDLRKQVGDLQEQATASSAANQDLQKQVHDLERLKADSESTTTENMRGLQDKIYKLEQEKVELEEKHQNAMAKHQDVVAKHEEQSQNHQASIESLQAQEADRTTETESLRNKIEELERLRADSETTATENVRGLEEKIDKLEKEKVDSGENHQGVVAKHEEQARNHQASLETLQTQGAEQTTETEGLRKQVEELERLKSEMSEAHINAVSKHDDEVKTLRETIENLQTQGSYKTTESEGLQGQIRELERSRDELSELHRDTIAKNDEAAETFRQTVENLQAKLVETQGHLDHASLSRAESTNELQETIESLRNEAKTLQQRAEEQASSKEKENADLTSVINELQTKVAEQQEKADDAVHRAEQEATSLNNVVADLQDQIQILQEKQSNDQAAHEQTEIARKHAVNEHAEARSVIDDLQSQVQTLRNSMENDSQAREKSHTELNAVVEDLQNQIQILQEKSANQQTVIEEAEGSTRELHGLRDQHDELQQAYNALLPELEDLKSSQKEYTTVKEDLNQRLEELALDLNQAQAAKNSAEESREAMQEELQVLQKALDTLQADGAEKDEHHLKAAAKLRRELEASHEGTLADLKSQHHLTLEHLRSNLATEHASSLEDFQGRFEALLAQKEAVEKILGDSDMRHNRELEEESQKHETAYRDLRSAFTQVKESQAQQLSDQAETHKAMTRQLQENITSLQEENGRIVAELEKDRAATIESLSAEYERNVTDIMARHAAQIAEVEEEAARRTERTGAERDRVHEAQMAALEAQHAEALKDAFHAPVAPEASVPTIAVDDEKDEPETPSRGLSHVFVNHETPMAYHSDDEHESTSTGSKKMAMQISRLKFALKAAQDEAKELKGEGSTSQTTTFRDTEAEHEEKPLTDQPLTAEPMPDDPFAPSVQAGTLDLKGAFPLPESTEPRARIAPRHDEQMSLEGTLESLRVQTKQLMEVHDDLLAENRRWSEKLRMRPSQQTNSSSSSPLKAAS